MERRYCNCGQLLYHDEELESGICDTCTEIGIENNQRRKEWRHYHPGTPCPASELIPYPKRKDS